MILVCWEEEKKKWNLKVRGTGHSWVKELFTDYIGAKRGKSTMESLQQATDGDGQRRNAQRYRESNVTLRRYIEDKRGQETSWWEALLVIKARSAAAVRAAQPETNGGPKRAHTLCKDYSVHLYSKEQRLWSGQAEDHLLRCSSQSLYSLYAFWLGLMLFFFSFF